MTSPVKSQPAFMVVASAMRSSFSRLLSPTTFKGPRSPGATTPFDAAETISGEGSGSRTKDAPGAAPSAGHWPESRSCPRLSTATTCAVWRRSRGEYQLTDASDFPRCARLYLEPDGP